MDDNKMDFKLTVSTPLYDKWVGAAAKLGVKKEELLEKLIFVADAYSDYDEGTLLAVVRGDKVLTTFTGL